MNNFAERIKAVNFIGRRQQYPGMDDDEEQTKFKVGLSDDELEEVANSMLLKKSSPLYKEARNKAIRSYRTLIELGADNEFRNKFKEVHKNDGEVEKLDYFIKEAEKWQKEAEKNSERKLLRSKAAMQAAQGLGNALTSGMEEPAKGFLEGMFNMMQELGVNVQKIKALKNDETNFDPEKVIDKLSGKKGALNDASKKSGVKVDENPKSNENAEKSEGKPESKSEGKESNKKLAELSPDDLKTKALDKKFEMSSDDKELIEQMKKLSGDQKFLNEFKKVHPKYYKKLYVEKSNFSERIRLSFTSQSMFDSMEAGSHIPESQIKCTKDPKKLIQLVLLAQKMEETGNYLTPQEISKKVGVTPGEAEWVARNYDEAQDKVSKELNKLNH